MAKVPLRVPAEQIVETRLELFRALATHTDAIADLRAVATKYSPGDFVVVAPWTSKDGTSFPAGHVALTHWTGPENQAGVWQYCGKPSGQIIQEFVSRYPKSNSPEPKAK